MPILELTRLKTRRRRLVAAAALAGVTGVAITPAAAQVVQQYFCNSPRGCFAWSNGGTGEGLLGRSAAGDGTDGSTSFNSLGQAKGKSGVEGNDFDTHGFLNAGVTGRSIHGAGLVGISQTGDGIDAASNNHWGGHFTSVTFGGLYADSKQGTGIVGIAEGTAPAQSLTQFGTGYIFVGVGNSGPVTTLDRFGSLSTSGTVTANQTQGVGVQGNSSSNAGIEGFSSAANGVQGFSSSGTGVFGQGSFGVSALTTTAGGRIFSGYDQYGSNVYFVDAQGGVHANSVPLTEVHTKRGLYATAYAVQATESTVEDVGRAQLAGGRADVALDPKFADSISDADYLVFVTPRGDSKGLYVSSLRMGGFSVRENAHGSSSLAFDYRIIAHPNGSSRSRLPLSNHSQFSAKAKRAH